MAPLGHSVKVLLLLMAIPSSLIHSIPSPNVFNTISVLFLHFLANSFISAYELSSVLDNYIIGTPKVVCEETEVALDILTSKPFIGNIFVKGSAKDASCRQSFGNPPKNETSIYILSLGKCGMQRLRSANPRGISFAVTVVVSFHPAGFITRNDRAYHLSCFYTEPEEIVTSSFEVSHLPAQELSDHMSLPSCKYSVHSGTLEGPSWANVGDTVYHIWECKGPELGILVKKCFVTDGDGEDHAVVDEDGCSLDLGLISEIVYKNDDGKMRAYAKKCAKNKWICAEELHRQNVGGERKKKGGKGEKDKKGYKGGKHEEKLEKLLEDLEVEVEGADWSLDEAKEERKKEMKVEKKEEEKEEEMKRNKNEKDLKKEEEEEEEEDENGKKKNEWKNKEEEFEWKKKNEEEQNGTTTMIGRLEGNCIKNKEMAIAEKEEDEENNAETVIGRGKRALLHQSSSSSAGGELSNQMEIDVASPQMLVLDREDQERIGSTKKPLKKWNNPNRKEVEDEQKICLAKMHLMTGLALILAILAGFGSLLALLALEVMRRRRRHGGNHQWKCQMKMGEWAMNE